MDGIEPSLVGLTDRCLTIWPHRNFIQSVQWGLNPRFLLGKQAGYHYIMDALLNVRLSKIIKSTGPDSNRRVCITGAASLPLDDQCFFSVGPQGLEP